MFCALLEEMVDHAFVVITDNKGVILDVEGDPEPSFGMTAASMEGKNVSIMMAPAVAARHDEYMKNYKGAQVEEEEER